jgi:hypothetical protein
MVCDNPKVKALKKEFHGLFIDYKGGRDRIVHFVE